jgi:hypothetical protein
VIHPNPPCFFEKYDIIKIEIYVIYCRKRGINMSSVVYSSELHQVVRTLKQYDSQKAMNFFKDSNWFESWSISAAEAQAVVKMFSKPARDYINKSVKDDFWQ